MAAPPEVNIGDLTGQWVMNKTLSDPIDPILALQGVGWWTRQALKLATVTLHVTQYTQHDCTHIDIAQTATGGISGTSENRTLDWTERSHSDSIFGDVNGKSRWLGDLRDVQDEWLRDGWKTEDEGAEKGGPNEERWVESWSRNEGRNWTARQVWGFGRVDEGKGEEERYHVRRVVVQKGEEILRAMLVYNYMGREP